MVALESPSRLEPCLLDEARGRLLDLVTELPTAAHQLTARLHPHTAMHLAELVRIMKLLLLEPDRGA